jgi:hypothetical protein
MRRGFLYLTAMIGGYSRYVLPWRLSIMLDGGFCLEALDNALSRGRLEIFNTDQSSQFTSREYTGRLQEAGIAVSRDGWERALERVRGAAPEQREIRNNLHKRLRRSSGTGVGPDGLLRVPRRRTALISRSVIGPRRRSTGPGSARAEAGRTVTNTGPSGCPISKVQFRSSFKVP